MKTIEVSGAELVQLIALIEEEQQRNRSLLRETTHLLKTLLTRKRAENDLHEDSEPTS